MPPDILFTDVRVFDGSGQPSFKGEVLVRDAVIAGVVTGADHFDRNGRAVIDGGGQTLMPGLIEPHAHLTFPSSVERLVMSAELPVEEHLLITAHNARIMLDQYPSGVGRLVGWRDAG